MPRVTSTLNFQHLRLSARLTSNFCRAPRSGFPPSWQIVQSRVGVRQQASTCRARPSYQHFSTTTRRNQVQINGDGNVDSGSGDLTPDEARSDNQWRVRKLYQHSTTATYDSGSGDLTPDEARSDNQRGVRKLYQPPKERSLAGSSQSAPNNAFQNSTSNLASVGKRESKSQLYETLLISNTDCWHGSSSEVGAILEDMTKEGVTPDVTILQSALEALSIHPDYLLRGKIQEEMEKLWLSPTQDSVYLLAGLIRERQFEKALECLANMRQGGKYAPSWLYEMMIHALCEVGELDEVLHLVTIRLDSNEPDISPGIWFQLLDTASASLHYPLTRLAFQSQVQTAYLNPPVGVCTNVLHTAARYGDIDLATSVFQILAKRSGNPIKLQHYEALLETYVAIHDYSSALSLLSTMAFANQPVSAQATRPIFSCLCLKPFYATKAGQVLEEFRLEERPIPIEALNVVLESKMYHGDVSEAIELYKSMSALLPDLKPNTSTFDILLGGCAKKQLLDAALNLVEEMTILNITANARIYHSLKAIYSIYEGNLDKT